MLWGDSERIPHLGYALLKKKFRAGRFLKKTDDFLKVADPQRGQKPGLSHRDIILLVVTKLGKKKTNILLSVITQGENVGKPPGINILGSNEKRVIGMVVFQRRFLDYLRQAIGDHPGVRVTNFSLQKAHLFFKTPLFPYSRSIRRWTIRRSPTKCSRARQRFCRMRTYWRMRRQCQVRLDETRFRLRPSR